MIDIFHNKAYLLLYTEVHRRQKLSYDGTAPKARPGTPTGHGGTTAGCEVASSVAEAAVAEVVTESFAGTVGHEASDDSD